MRKTSLTALLLLVCLVGGISPVFAAAPEAPAGYIGSVELNQIFDLAHLVDCRSRLEYDVLHMENAVHVPFATMVREDLERLLDKDPSKAIVFYGNGEGCLQGRAAFVKAGRWGYENIFMYRPGIFAWAKEKPEKVLFFGEILGADSPRRLLALDHYLASCLSPIQFIESTRQPGTKVVDIRDTAERESFSIILPHLQHYPLDKLAHMIKSGSRKVKGGKLFILDSCGGQSQWLQYILDDNGIDYAFLKGGVAAWRRAALDSYGNTLLGADQ